VKDVTARNDPGLCGAEFDVVQLFITMKWC